MSQAYEELEKLVATRNELNEQIYQQCKLLVDLVLDGSITDEKVVNSILEAVTYLCDGKRYIELDRLLCRHIITYYPQLIGPYLNTFQSRAERKGSHYGRYRF